LRPNVFDDCFTVTLNVLGTDPEEANAESFQPPLPMRVVLLGEIMREPVHFYGQLEFLAVEVQHVIARRLLASELQAIEAPVSERGPEETLRVGR